MIVPLTVQDPPACVHLSPGADLHVHMRLHVMRRSPSRLVCIVIIVTLDDATWVTSRTPTCPLLPWVHFNVLTARVLCRKCCHVVRALHTQLTLVPTLDEVTSITSYASKCSHYAIQNSVISAQRFAMHRVATWSVRLRNHYRVTLQSHSASPRPSIQVQLSPLATTLCRLHNKHHSNIDALATASHIDKVPLHRIQPLNPTLRASTQFPYSPT